MASKNKSIPTHVAFIVDGNRRWARKKNLPSGEGHSKGAKNLEEVLKACDSMGIKCVTAWLFSTENWKRSKKEIEGIFSLIRSYLDEHEEKFLKEKTRFVHLGRKDRFPKDIIEKLNGLEKKTSKFTDKTVCLALDYGGHDELIRAFKKMREEKLEITEENIEKCLDTKGLPKIDLIIRTGGVERLSGFMSWQSHYAELYFTKKHFPEFTPKDLEKAIDYFGKVERRFGGNQAATAI